MSRTTKEEVLQAFQGEDFRQKKREIQAIQKDIATARGIIVDGRNRYIKQHLRLRNKKAAAENPFADLDAYNSQRDIQDTCGWELITEAEMDIIVGSPSALATAMNRTQSHDSLLMERLQSMCK